MGELNRRLKKKGITKSRQKEIKSERRTLKNRGYASNCRISREDEEKRLEKDIIKLEDEMKKYPPLEHLQSEYLQLRNDVRQMKESMNLSDSDSDESDIPVMDDTKEEIKDEDDESSSTDEDNYEN